MLSRHMNEKFSAGKPLVDYDRYYAQDIIRDRRFFEEYAGELIQLIEKNSTDNMILSGLWCSQGAGHTMNITAGKGLVKFNVTIPSRSVVWAIPPTTETIDIMKVVEAAAQTNLSLAGIDTGGVNHNYAKLAYVETDGNTRTYAKKTGTYAYENYPDYVITFGTAAPTAYELKIAEFTSNGVTLTFINNGTRQYLGAGAEDITVYTQSDFNAIVERVSAGVYQFKTGLQSIYFKNLSGGYLFSGFLSGGDTFAVLQTNGVTRIVMEEGASFHCGDTASWFQINTVGFIGDGIYVQGTGNAAAAVSYSYLVGAERVTLRNCITQNRYTNTDFDAFNGGNYKTAAFIHCKVITVKCATAGATLRAFHQCYNMTDCYVSTFTPANGIVKVLDSCEEVNNLYITGVSTANALTVVYNSNNITGFDITTVTGTTGQTVHIMDTCNQISSGIIQTVSGGIITGMYSCSNISDFNITGFTGTAGVNLKGMDTCNQISSGIIQSFSTGVIVGIYNCTSINNAKVYSFTNTSTDNLYGIQSSSLISGCVVSTLSSANPAGGCIGIYNCNYISNSQSISNTASGATGAGFSTCNYISSCIAQSNKTTGYVSCHNITASYALSNSTYGFLGCNSMGFNKAASNTSGNYSTSYADAGSGNACADTAAGGYNS